MRYLLIICFFIVPAFCQAQILNIEKATLDKDTARVFVGNMTVSFSLNNRSAAADAPVELRGFQMKSSFALFPGRHRISFINDFNYLRINEDPFLNTGYQHVRINFFKDKRVHPEAFVQAQYDNFRGLFPRLITGAAMRHGLLKGEKISFIFSVGAMFEHERWRHPNTTEVVNMNLLKSTNYLIFRWQISKGADFNFVNFYQTGYDREAGVWRNRYSTEANLNASITNRISLTNTFILGYEDKPIVPITQTIYSISTGLTFKIN